MNVSIREKSNAVDKTNERGWKTRELIPNGKLAVKIGGFEFIDSDSRLLEDQIEKILIKIETGFQEWKERRLKWKIEEEKREELRKIEEAQQKLKDDELSKFVKFYNDAQRWKKFMILKEYFEYKKTENPDNQEWIQWAKKKLDWYDPAKNVFDELLDCVDKETLEDKSKKKWGW